MTRRSKNALSCDRIRTIVRAGAGAQLLVEMTARAKVELQSKTPDIDPIELDRKARDHAHVSMTSPVTGPGMNKDIDRTTKDVMAFIAIQERFVVERESFWSKVLIHATAAAIVVLFGSLVLVGVGFLAQAHQDSKAVQMGARMAHKAIETIVPEALPDTPSLKSTHP